MLNILLILPVALPMALALLWRLLRLEGRRLQVASLSAMGLAAALAAVNALLPQAGEISLGWTGSLSLCFRVDGLSRVYLLLIALIWPCVGLYATEYLEHDARTPRFFMFYTLTQGVLHGLALSGNLVTFYVFYESMTLLTLPLVAHNMDPEAQSAAVKYLLYSIVGASAALAGLLFIGSLGAGGDFAAGPLSMDRTAGREGLALGFGLTLILGFCVKAGLFPLHNWLPAAHPVSPAPDSAVLSGLITKMGVLGVIRAVYCVLGVERLRGTWVQALLMVLSLLTVLMGSVMAFREKHIKKRQAYSSMSQLSYVLFGLFTMTEAGFIGALLHVVFHALMKNTLFMGAGAVIHKTEKTNVDDLDGMGRRMPWTYAFFTVASLGLVGIPPTGGFLSKWFLAQGALSAGLPFAWVGPAVLLLSAILTAAYLFSIVIRGCFPVGDAAPGPRCEVGWRMLVPMGVCAALTVLLGVFSGPLVAYLRALAGGLMG